MSSTSLNRRQFVLLGGATVATLASGLPARGSTAIPTSFVSVGYHSGRSRFRLGGRSSVSPMRFVDGRSVPSGDPRFFREGARIRLHSFHRGEGNLHPERVDVEILFQVPELEQPAPFYAFSSVPGPDRQMTSNSIAFNVPVESTGYVELSIRRSASKDDVPELVTIPFAVNDGDTPAIKLNEGIYALALIPVGDAAPDWRSIRSETIVTRDDKDRVQLVYDDFGEPRPVPFDYLLMSVSQRQTETDLPRRGVGRDEEE